eukprot:362298-Chlamydomonas_euryale.AAC.1
MPSPVEAVVLTPFQPHAEPTLTYSLTKVASMPRQGPKKHQTPTFQTPRPPGLASTPAASCASGPAPRGLCPGSG